MSMPDNMAWLLLPFALPHGASADHDVLRTWEKSIVIKDYSRKVRGSRSLSRQHGRRNVMPFVLAIVQVFDMIEYPFWHGGDEPLLFVNTVRICNLYTCVLPCIPPCGWAVVVSGTSTLLDIAFSNKLAPTLATATCTSPALIPESAPAIPLES
jgi:hypothetical protein